MWPDYNEILVKEGKGQLLMVIQIRIQIHDTENYGFFAGFSASLCKIIWMHISQKLWTNFLHHFWDSEGISVKDEVESGFGMDCAV